jgi:trehalose 6-phosphate phosphatase
VTSAGGWSVKVGRGPTSAHFRLRDVSAVRAWLAAMAHDGGKPRGTTGAA